MDKILLGQIELSYCTVIIFFAAFNVGSNRIYNIAVNGLLLVNYTGFL